MWFMCSKVYNKDFIKFRNWKGLRKKNWKLLGEKIGKGDKETIHKKYEYANSQLLLLLGGNLIFVCWLAP